MAPPGAGEGAGLADQDQIPPDAGLGPDLYRNTGFEPQQSALAPQGAPGGSGQPQAAPGGGPPQAAGAPPGGPPAQPGAGPGAAPGADGGGKGTSFRDIWNAQDKDTRQQYLDKLQNHLKATNETIDSAYNTMMKQLGGRPDTELSKQEKGMLLMEFGMRMMEHSSGRMGYGRDTGAAAGAAGVETIGSMRGLQKQKLDRQEQYDKLQQQLTIAQGREKTNLAARSALEEGRDIRAFGAQDTSLARTAMQQAGGEARTESRNTAAAGRVATTEAGKDRRSALARGDYVRQFADERGLMFGVNKRNQVAPMMDPNNPGTQLKGQPGSSRGGAGGKGGFAAEANYRMYMDTYGKDNQNQPLTGEAARAVQRDALQYASNPRGFALTEPKMREMAEKSADNYIRSNSLSWAGASDEEIAAKRTAFAEETFQRLKRNGTAGPSAGANVPNKPKSALAGTDGGAAIPFAPPRTMSPQLQTKAEAFLKANPATAPAFLKKYSYLPQEFRKYLAPGGGASALQ